MQYSVLESENGKYLIVKVIGKITIPVAIAFTLDAQRRSNETGIDRLLYDVTEAENVESAVDNFGLMYDELPKMKVKRTNKVILLTARDDHSHDFIETACRNAGYDVTISRDLKSAIAMIEEVKSESA